MPSRWGVKEKNHTKTRNISGWHFLPWPWQTENDPLKNDTRIIQQPLTILTIKIFPFSSFRSTGMLFPFGYLVECILLLTWSCQEWVGALPFSAPWLSVFNSTWRELVLAAAFPLHPWHCRGWQISGDLIWKLLTWVFNRFSFPFLPNT